MSDDKKLKVLIVDDDPESLSYLGLVFRSAGCVVQTVTRVRQLRWQMKHKFDVVVLDLMMPDRDGIQVIQAMARSGAESALIIVSGCPDRILSSAENFARMSGLRVLGALRKPVWKDQVDELLAPLKPHAAARPHIEEQEFFRMLSSGNLMVHYAPIIDTQRAVVHEVEAVARVHHPKLGMMSPSGMWDTAEALGAALKIKSEMRRTAIADCARFAAENLHPVVSCEVPAVELQETDFADQFLAECRERGVLPSSISINVTESDLRQNFIPALGTLTRLAMRGMQLAIDDYGSGSLTGGMLARLPVTELRLGEKLVAATLRETDARCRALDIVAYSKRHDFRVVAKGVTTKEHLGLLMDLGIAAFEGPVFTRIKSFEEVVYWIRNAGQHLKDLGIQSHLRTESKEADGEASMLT